MAGQKSGLKRLYIRQRASHQRPQAATVDADPEHNTRKDKSKGMLPVRSGKITLDK
jgi:hypothetical protein